MDSIAQDRLPPWNKLGPVAPIIPSRDRAAPAMPSIDPCARCLADKADRHCHCGHRTRNTGQCAHHSHPTLAAIVIVIVIVIVIAGAGIATLRRCITAVKHCEVGGLSSLPYPNLSAVSALPQPLPITVGGSCRHQQISYAFVRMAFPRAICVLAAFALLRPTTASLYSYQSPVMASPGPPNLNVHIESASEPSVLKVTISNTHESTPLTILTWDAPFERSARDSGVYHIQPTTPGGTELESLGIRIKRRLPAPRTALLEIPPQSDVTRDLELRSSWIPTDGQRYKVWAKGSWRAVWTKSIQQITDEELEDIVGDFGEDATFETNVVDVVLT